MSDYGNIFDKLAQCFRKDGWEVRQEDPPQAYMHVSRPGWGDEHMDGIHLETYVLGNQLASGFAPVALHCEQGFPHQQRFMELFTERVGETIKGWPGYKLLGPHGCSVCEISIPLCAGPSGPFETGELLAEELRRLQTLGPLIDETIADLKSQQC